MDSGDLITVSELAERSGFAPSAIRFYDNPGAVYLPNSLRRHAIGRPVVSGSR